MKVSASGPAGVFPGFPGLGALAISPCGLVDGSTQRGGMGLPLASIKKPGSDTGLGGRAVL